MKKIILVILASVALGALSSCGYYQNAYMGKANPSFIPPAIPPSS